MKRLLLLVLFTFVAFSWQVSAQFNEDFEGGTFPPSGWAKELGDAANDITQSNSQNHTSGGTYSARFSSYTSASDYNQYLFTASITVQAGVNDQISFWHRKYNSSAETLEWGVSTTSQSSTAVSSWTAVTLSTSWDKTTVDLSSYVGQTIYFAWHYYGNYLFYVYLDDVVNDAIPSCPAPTNQTESNITDVSADLGWTEAGTSTTWDIEYGPTGFTQGTGTTITGVTNPYTLSGLTANTTYDWYVRADCGGGSLSTWTGPSTFTTTPTPGTCGLFRVDLIDSYGDGWNSGVLDVYINGVLYYDDLTLSNGSGPESYQIPVDIGDILSFDYTEGSYGSENEYKVYDETDTEVADEGNGSNVPGDIGDPSVPSGLTACAACPAPTNQTVAYTSTTSADLGWTEAGSATTWDVEWGTSGFTQGTGTMITGTTTNPQSISGLTPRTDYDFYVRSDCGGGSLSSWTGPHTWKQPDTGDDCTLPIVVAVVADCGSATPTTLNFVNAITEELPSCDGFGNYGYWIKATIPSSGAIKITNTGTDIGLSIYDACGGNEVYCNNNSLGSELYLSGFTPNSDYFFYFWKDNQSGTADICFEEVNCLFPTNLGSSNITSMSADLSWDAGGSETVWNIEYGPTGYTQGTGTTITGVTTNPYTLSGLSESTAYDWYVQADCAASGGTDQSAWSGPNSFTTLPVNDDCSGAIVLTVGVNGTCPGNQVSASALGATDDGATSCDASSNFGVWFEFTAPSSGEVVINYTAGTATGNPGVVVFDACGGTEVTGTCQDNTASLANITGLSANATYKLLLWFDSGMGSFDICLEDIPACPNPTNQTESNITDVSAELGWTEAGTSTTWDIEYGPTGYTQGTGTTITGVTNPYTLSGLTGNTTYDWYVRADCGGGSLSPWTGPSTFTTALSPGTCGLFRVDLIDSYGDGWNSGVLDVYINGVLYYDDLTLSSGSGPESYQIPVDIGDILSFDYTEGNYGSENEYKVYDETDTEVADEGNGSNVPGDIGDYTIPTGLTACATCPNPTNQTESNITDVSAELGWTEAGSATTWDIEWGTTGFALGTGTMVTGITTNPYTLSGLTANTTYDWYVRADCGGGDLSSWSGPSTFTTIPTNDNCSGATVLIVGAQGDCPTNQVTSDATNATADGNTGCDNIGNNIGVWFSFTAPALGTVNINYAAGTATGNPGYAVYDACGGNEVFCQDNTSSTPILVTGLTGGNVYKLLVWYDGSGQGTFDICLEEGPCEIPTGLTANNETTSGADLSWTENGGADHWDLFIVETSVGTVPDASTTPTVDNTSDNPYTWTGGNPSTDYDWYVRADCGASGGSGQSAWSAKGTFTTTSADAVDWCNLQFPDQATITVGGSVDVYAQVYEPGVTDAVGQGAGITSWIGYSTSDTDPSTWTDWVAATYNVDVGNNDEYKAALGSGLAPGTYYYASRFKLNSGAYQYGGYSSGGGGFWDGTNYVSGILTVNNITGDLCSGAIGLTVNDDCSFSQYSNNGATDSGETPAPGCGSYNGADIWFSFVVPSSGHVIIDTKQGDITDGAMAAYSGSCGSLTLIECDDDDSDNGLMPKLDLVGLTPGETVYIRFWEYGGNVFGTFEICVQKGCPSGLVVLPASSAATTSNESCIEGNWIHYYNGTNILLSLDLTNAGITSADISDVTIDPDGATDAFWANNDSDGFPDVEAPNTGGAFMKRKWNVNEINQPTGDVGVRFYYTTDEFNAVNTVITNHSGTALTSTSQLNFYKVLSGEDPWYLEPGGIDSTEVEIQTSGGVAGINTFVDGIYSGEHYAEFLVSSFSGGGGGGASNGANLPLNLIAFSGYADKDANILTWSTLTETNTSMFYVERSESGDKWTSILKVEAAGNSYTKKDYQALDNEPVARAFYRLRMMDKNGRFSISKVISIERKVSGLKLNAIYPNPNDGNFIVNITSKPENEGRMILINSLGVKVYTRELNQKGGRNIEKINVSHLPTGVYTLLLEQNDEIITKRVVINR